MNRFGFGLRTTIVLNLSLVMVITMLLISFVVITIAKKTMYDNKSKTAEALLRSVQNRSLPYFSGLPDTKRNLCTLAEECTFLHNFESIAIVDSSLTILASSNRYPSDTTIPRASLQNVIQSGRVLTEFQSKKGRKYLSLSGPIKKNQSVLGAVNLQFSLENVEESMAQFQHAVILFALSTAITFIVIGTILLTRYLVKPLEKLILATEGISDGYLPQHLEASRSNEIGTLSVSLSRMSDKLREDKEKINAYIKSLEETNRKLKLAQDELIRSEKLASVGRLSAGIAHEIGNPIGIILGYVSILRQQITKTTETDESLNRLEKEVMRIDAIIRELLSFSRPSKISFKQIQPNAVIQEATSIISHHKEFRNINLHLDLDESLPTIMGDERLLQQVLINLFINGMDSMPKGGILSVSTEYRKLTNYGPLDHSLANDGITILVRDTGSGIEQKDIQKIFDPFFTTKSPGKGTGLGLAVSYRIIESLGGIITVQSVPGKGTTFTIILPKSRKNQDTVKKTA